MTPSKGRSQRRQGLSEISDGGSLLVTNARLVLDSEVVDGGAVAIVDGTIVEVGTSEQLRSNGLPVLDARGAFCLPGLVNLHDDEIETEMNPRPSTNLPVPFAHHNYLLRALASGITTTWVALAFADMPWSSQRTIEGARKATALIRARPRRVGVDQHVLHRFQVDRADWLLDEVFPSLAQATVRGGALLGTNTYRGYTEEEQERLARVYPFPEGCVRLLETYFSPGTEAREADLLAAPPGDVPLEERVAQVLALIHREQRRAPFMLCSHDDGSAEKVDLLHAIGVTVCEMPVAWEAVRRANELGMPVSVGAPNIARGGSTRGKLAAAEIVADGLADIIVADYHAPSLLYAVFEVVRLGCTDLPSAVRMASSTPARVAGMPDRGAIEPGRRGDLIVVDASDNLPHVRASIIGGRVRYTLEDLPLAIPAAVA